MDLEQIISALKTVLAEKQDSVKFSEEAVANISAQIAESIKNKNNEFKAQLAAAEDEKAKAVADAEKLRVDLDQAVAKLNELETAVKAKASEELFNTRMSLLDQEYDFDDSDRAILAKDLNSLENSEESFASYKEKVSVLFKHKSKAFKAEQEKVFQEKLEAELAKRLNTVKPTITEATASSAVATVEVETALANAKVEAPAVPAQSIEVTEATVSWKERLTKAFSKDNITIKY